MKDITKIKDWWFSKKIEDFPEEELADRIREVMELNLADKIIIIPFVGGEQLCEYATQELIGLCPATGYPDIYGLVIRFVPDKHLPELKSLKFYLMQYMNLPISHEHLIEKIYMDFSVKVKPEKLYIELTVNVRGGIYTTIQKGVEL